MRTARITSTVGNITFFFSTMVRKRKFDNEINDKIASTSLSLCNRFKIGWIKGTEALAAFQLYRTIEPEFMRIIIDGVEEECPEKIQLSVSVGRTSEG